MVLKGMGIVICLLCLAGCGGGAKGKLVTAPPAEPVVETGVATPDEEDTLTQELSPNRVEELYAKSGIPGWDPSLEEELKKWEHQVKFDTPIQVNRQVRAYLVYFSTERQSVIRRYLARSTQYLPMIRETFQEYGLPEDLAYLAMIESGFNNKAYSSAAAMGMWQFIRGTGLRYGLAINSYVDERRDPEKATRAAAKYLLDLYKRFGSWYLAAASYNCGEGRVQKELNTSNHKNFWDLSANQCLPTETKNYVPQMIAATIIAKNPEKFGFKNVPYLPPLKTEKAKVDEPTSIKAAAWAINVPTEEMQALNPELLRGVTPPGMPSYTLNLPPGSQDLFARNITMARMEQPAVASRPVREYRAAAPRSSSTKSYSRSTVATGPSAATKSASYTSKSGSYKPKSASYKKGKTRTVARSAKAHATYAKKENTNTRKENGSQDVTQGKPKSAAPSGNVQTASMFPASFGGRQEPKAAKGKPVAVSASKGKTAKAGSKKSAGAPSSKKGEATAKNSGKAKTPKKTSATPGKTHDKFARAKTPGGSETR